MGKSTADTLRKDGIQLSCKEFGHQRHRSSGLLARSSTEPERKTDDARGRVIAHNA